MPTGAGRWRSSMPRCRIWWGNGGVGLARLFPRGTSWTPATDADFEAYQFHFTDECWHNEAPGVGLYGLCVRRCFCLMPAPSGKFGRLQQFHNQGCLYILCQRPPVNHGGIVFKHLFRSSLLACDGGLDRGAVQQHFLSLPHPSPLLSSFYALYQH